MERLPQEIIDKIASISYRDQWSAQARSAPLSPWPPHSATASISDQGRLGILACVSRKWQFAVERLLFRSLAVRSSELDEFEYSKTLSIV